MAAAFYATFSHSSSSNSESDNEQYSTVEVADFNVPHDAFSKVMSSLSEEELIVKSSKGPLILMFVLPIQVVRRLDILLLMPVNRLSPVLKKISLHKLWKNFHLLQYLRS